MMGDRDYGQLIKNAVDSIGREMAPKIDAKDTQTIHLHEVVRCLRRSYFDRVDPLEVERRGFTDLVSSLLGNMKYGTKSGEFKMQEINLSGKADMIVDDVIMIFRSTNESLENPLGEDLLYLNACMWIFNKPEGIIIYVAADKKETSFTLSRNTSMFEELSRRVRIFNDLLKENKVPILEPSDECRNCQYYERCYVKKRIGRSLSFQNILGMEKKD